MQESAGYPSSSAKLAQNAQNLLDLPNGAKMTVSWFKQHIWSETECIDIPEADMICGMQANIYKICLKNAKGEAFKVVVKRVIPKELPPKASKELWKDFLISVRHEIEFYCHQAKLAPELFPKVYYSGGQEDPEDLMNSFYLILLQDVSDEFYQRTSMNQGMAEDLMRSLAKLHATFWIQNENTTTDKTGTRGSFWVLSRRKPLGEIESADQVWKSMLSRFPNKFDYLDIPNIENLGRHLASKAEVLDDFISAHLMTQIHGDCKGWNLFFNKTQGQVLFIDLQWTGLGHPLQDVAYALTTSLDSDLLENMSHFVEIYLLALKANLPNSAATVDLLALKSQFDLVWLDYARVIVTGLWKRFSPEQIIKNENTIGPSMIGRSIAHAEFIMRKIYELLVVKALV